MLSLPASGEGAEGEEASVQSSSMASTKSGVAVVSKQVKGSRSTAKGSRGISWGPGSDFRELALRWELEGWTHDEILRNLADRGFSIS